MRSAITLVLGILLAAAAPGLRAQAKPAAPAGAKPAPPAASQAAPQTAKPAAPAATKRAAKPPRTKAAKAPKPAKPVETALNPDAPKEGEERSGRRDPFESLVARQQAQSNAGKNLPPGKAGLQVSTLRLDGIVKAPNGMIAVVTNRPEVDSANAVVLDYCAVVRGILNDDQGGPLHPPGLRMTDALDEVRESIQRNLDEKKGGSRKSNSADSPTASTKAWTKFGPNKRQSETT